MPEPETEEMDRTGNCSVYCFMLMTLLFSLSCLVASAFVVVDRGDIRRAPEMVYSDFPKKEFHNVPETLPCADIDEYDAFDMPNSGDIKENQNEPRLDANEDVSDIDQGEIGEKKGELKSKKNEDAEEKNALDFDEKDDRSEEYEERENDFEHYGNAGEEMEDEENSWHSGVSEEDTSDYAMKRRHDMNPTPSKLHRGKIGHHKVKLKKIDSPEEEVGKLEKEIERIAEGDEMSRRRIHRKRNDPKHRKQKKMNYFQDREYDLTDWKSEIRSKNDEYADRDYEPDESSPYHQRNKRHRVLGQRHLSADDESLATVSKRDAPIDVDDWGYCGDMGPEKWQEKWPDCGGNAQSPINLDTSVAKVDYEPILKWKGYSNTPSKMTLINNGHSVILTTSYEDCGSRPFIFDSRMNHEYVFGELTFHWGADESSGSEHTINYMKYPLEMQVIHYRRELGSIEKAQEVPGGIAIVGILYHIDSGKRQNQGIADIQSGFAKIHDGPSSTTIQAFPMSRIIPQFTKHYLTYNGSMTTPPCTETVIWIVHLKQAAISKKQLAKFHRLKNEGVELKQNNRPIQKSNKRCVFEIT